MRESTRPTRALPWLLLATFLMPSLAFAQDAPPPPPPPPPDVPAPPPAPPEPTPPASPQPPPDNASLTPIGVPPVAAPATPPSGAPGGLKINGTSSSIKLGFLLQPGFEYDSATVTSATKTDSIFLRRARLMVGMTLGSQFELFAETDSPNLGKATGASGNPGVNMQDAFGTWNPGEEFKLDVGLMLVPFSHNSVQGATTLYGWDYFAYTFQQIGGLTNYIGRDLGAQFRGLLMKHLEYRLAIFQGNRGVPTAPAGMMAPPAPSRTPMRFMARLQYNILDAETAYFYAGTYGGTKKILSIGGAVDHQDDYTAFAGDVFVDLPVGSDVLTAQFNVVHYDGGTWIPGLAKQTDLMGELGYRIGALQLSPIVRVETLTLSNPTATAPNVLRLAGGLAYWVMNHNVNVKLFYTYIKPDSDSLQKVHQINLQMQFYVF
jgi:hypothetical protein